MLRVHRLYNDIYNVIVQLYKSTKLSRDSHLAAALKSRITVGIHEFLNVFVLAVMEMNLFVLALMEINQFFLALI